VRHDGPFYPRDRIRHPAALTPGYKSSVLRSPRHAPLSIETTQSEMTGPVFGHDILGPLDHDLIRNHAQTGDAIGQRIVVYGRVVDENDRAVAGSLVEIWQANAGGRYRHAREGYQAALDPNFGGWGRAITDADGWYSFRTIKPGAYPWPNGVNDWRPAHIHFSLFGNTFAQRLVTQMYFEGDPMIWQCPIVATVPTRAGVEQLVATLDRRSTVPMDALAYRWDIVLRGRRATFFEEPRA